MVGGQNLGAKKNYKQKTHKHFSDGPCGTIVPGTNPHPSQGQTGQNGDFTVELNRERPVCPRDGSHFVPGRGPICPRDGSCLSGHRPAENVYVYWFFSFPKNRSSKDRFRPPPLAQNSAEHLDSAIETLPKKAYTELQRFCRTLGAKPNF